MATHPIHAGSVFTLELFDSPASGRVVLKYPTAATPSPKTLARLEREYEIGSSLNVSGVRRVLGRATWYGRPALELEYVEGESLGSYLGRGQNRRLETVLQLALSAAGALESLHAAGVVHRDVAAGNLLVTGDGQRVVIIDLESASRGGGSDTPGTATEGHLAYLSPEQTGRIELPADERSDLYSFGVVLYEMLTGALPFRGEDAAGWIHAHLARVPESPSAREPSVPPVVSAIVLRLLAKAPESRYQTARGLCHDLRKCLDTLQAAGDVRDFPLGRGDHSGRLRSPQSLYGRDAEQRELLAALERAVEGQPGLRLVAGFSGVGKTALVNELRFPAAVRGGLFLAGKFDQTLNAIPYSAFAEAFGQLCHHLLAGTAEEVRAFRRRVLESLGANAGLLLGFVPQLEGVIGRQQEPPQLGTAESANRFALTLLGFFDCVVAAKRPLVLFLDDAQWADAASLDLLHMLVTRTVSSHFLIVCAYRDNELGDRHPLLALIETLRREGAGVDRTSLGGLTLEQSEALLGDTLDVSAEEASPLAALIYDKTAGNPFFLRQVLEVLVREDALHFDGESDSWSWEAARVNAQDISENVVELMVRKIARLPEGTRGLLQVAACIGNAFPLDLLAAASHTTGEDLRRALKPAIDDGLLATLDHSGRFTHDRIQQAIYESISRPAAQRTHLWLGRFLASREQSREQLLAAVQQLNLGAPLIDSTEEAVRLAELNLRAGHAAKAAMAWGGARDFYGRGLALLDRHGAGEPALRFELGLHQAEAGFYLGEVAPSVRRLRGLLQDAPDVPAGMRIYQLLIDIHTVELELADALAAGVEALGSLGITLPTDGSGEALLAGVAEIDELLAERGVESLDPWPEMTDAQELAALGLMAHLAPPAYIAAAEMFPLLAIEFVRRVLRGGLSRYSSFGFGVYGMLLAVALRRYERARDVGRLAVEIAQRSDNAGMRARVNFFHAAFIEHWCAPLESTLPYLDRGWRAGVENGDLQFASYCINHIHGNGLFAGQSLVELEQSLQHFSDINRVIRQEDGQHFFSMLRRTVEALREPAEGAPDLAVDHGGGTIVSFWHETGNATVLSFYYGLNCLLAVVFERSGEALAAAEQAASFLGGVMGMTWWPHHRFLYALALCSAAREGRIEAAAALEQVRTCRDEFKEWAAHSPANYLPKLLLIEAEAADLAGEGSGALLDAYDAAIDAAVDAGRTFDHALACERASGCWLRRGKHRVAAAYLQEALQVYETWGAGAKVEQLLRDHAPMLAGLRPRESAGRSESSSDGLHSADVYSVLKAAQTVAGELVLDRMLSRLIGLVIETAGAQSGFLLLSQDGEWRVVAGQRPDREGVEVLEWQPLADHPEIAGSVVHYVARTQKPVNLADARKSTVFASDPSIVARRCKSILCLPIINRGELAGILYLENNLSPHAFTRTHIRVLQLLANQAISSLEISRYYARVQALEEQLMQSQKLESIGRLAGGIAHDVNNMLTPILGHAELLQMKMPEGDERRDDLEEILRSAERVRDIAGQLLAFARKQTLETKPLDLNAVLSGFERILRRTIREDVDIETAYAPELGSVMGDVGQIEQAVLNLAINAQDAMPEGGRLTITTAAAVVDDELAQAREGLTPGPHVLLSVSDTGAGMDETTRARIFEPFFTTKGVGEGTGLGLSMVYGVVKQHGGFVEVDSTPGRGTTFKLYFPATSHPAVTGREEARGEAPGGSETVLVVEDQEAVLELTSRVLSIQGYQVLEASSGAAALALAEAHEGPIDLLIADVVMPGMNGREVYEALQRARGDLKVLYMSGYPDDVISTHGALHPGIHFLQKPISVHALASKVREVLDGEPPP